MGSISTAVIQFLAAQKERLKQRTYRDYESVMDLFTSYLNSYAPQHLEEKDHAMWEGQWENDEEAYTKLFPVSYIDSFTYADFLEYFVIRKVASGESFMKDCVRVLKKFSTWSFENEYLNEKQFADLDNYFKGGKSSGLANAEKAADLLYDHSQNNQMVEFEEEREGYFTITNKKEMGLRVEDTFTGEKLDGQLVLPEEIVDLCEVGWEISLSVGKQNGKWYVIEVGNIYPSD